MRRCSLAFGKGQYRVVSTFRLLIAAGDRTSQLVHASLAPFGYVLQDLAPGADLFEAIRANDPDIVVLGEDLPQGSAPDLVRALRINRATEELPVMFIVTDGGSEVEMRAYQAGADDVQAAGLSGIAFRARIRILLRLTTYRRRLQNEKRRLELKVNERTRELFEITLATVAALEKATELSDEETGHHMLRVAGYSALLATQVGLSPEMVEKIRLYAPLHDVGKVGVPHEILKKEGVLTRAEFEQMKRHTVFGFDLLAAAKADLVARNIALSHHERMDGSGYPYGLKGDTIPIEARIVAVADVFDALVTKRRYKEAMPPNVAMTSITVDLATRFDPLVVDAFSRRKEAILEVWESYR